MTYTTRGDPIIEKCIRDQLNTSVKIILHHLRKKPLGIILCGGFGRGEGTVIKDGQQVKPVNDYDLLIVSAENQIDTQKIGEQITRTLGIKLVEVGVISPDELRRLPPSQWAYDLKYGSCVIFGDKDVWQLIPEISPKDIPKWEAIKLLCNRMAGILGSIHYNSKAQSLAIKNKVWFRVQIDHMLIACGDASLILCADYHHLYREKLKRLFTHIHWFTKPEVKKIAEAYKRKLSIWGPKQTSIFPVDKELSVIGALAKKTYLRALQSYLERNVYNLTEAIQFYYEFHRFSKVSHLKRLITYMLEPKKHHSFNILPASPIHICYTFVPLVFFSGPWVPWEERFDIMRLLKKFLRLTSLSPKFEWEQARSMTYSFWELYCH